MLDLRQPGRGGPPRQPGATTVPPRAPAGRERALPCVLLVSRAADQEAAVLQALLRGIGIPVARLDAETAGAAGLVLDLAGRAVCLDGRWITPAVTWIRHFSVRAMADGARSDRAGAAGQMFSRDSWQALATGLAAVSAVTVGSQGPGLLAQLALAAAAGIAVPATVVAADLAAGAVLLPPGRLVVKALHQHFVEASPGLLTGVFPELTDSRALAGAAGGPAWPAVLQQYVEHDTELRVYYLHDEVLAFEVGKDSPAGPWLRPRLTTVRQADPPGEVVAAVRRLARAMSLEYGAFDFLLTGRTPTFLEVNLTGDWRWIEKRVGENPVSLAAARMLRALYAATSPDPGAGRRPVELTTFLTAFRREFPDAPDTPR